MFKRLRPLAPFLLLIFSSVPATAEVEVGKSYYCIQVFSAKEFGSAERRLFKKLTGKFKDVRVERIDGLLTLRVGFWEKIGRARRALALIRKMGVKGVFLRRCYYLPNRWVLPERRPVKKKVQRVEKVFREEKGKKGKERELKALIASLTVEKVKLPKRKLQKISFPETRTREEEKKEVNLSFLTAVNRDLSKTFSLAKFTFKGIGVGLKREGGRAGACLLVENVFAERWLGDVALLKVGVLKRQDLLESWTPLSADLSADFVDKRASLSLSYQGFRNYANHVNLKGLFSLAGKFRYYPSDTSTVSVYFTYDNFISGRELPFSTGSRLGLSFNTERMSSHLILKGNSYLLQVTGRFGKGSLSLFTDRSLTLPPESKGQLYGEGYDPLLSLDPFNLTGVKVSLPLWELLLTGSVYRVNDRDRYVLLGQRRIRPQGSFLGTTFNLRYRLVKDGKELGLSGGVFFPGTAFDDRKPEAGGYLDVKVSW